MYQDYFYKFRSYNIQKKIYTVEHVTLELCLAGHGFAVAFSSYPVIFWQQCLWEDEILLREAFQKKNCRFRDVVPIGFTRPPLKPNWDIFNWDNLNLSWPLPPVFAIET